MDVINDNKKPIESAKQVTNENVKNENVIKENKPVELSENKEIKFKIEEKVAEKDVRVESKNSCDEADRVKKLVEETTKRTNEVLII